MLYIIWGFLSFVIFLIYPMFFSKIEMVGFSSFNFFVKRVVASVMTGGIALVLLSALIQSGN